MICVWRVFSHYKLPLWAESLADPRENSGKHVNRLVTTASYSQSTNMYGSNGHTVYTSTLCLNPHVVLYTKVTKQEAFNLPSGWRNLTKVGINTISALQYTLLTSFSLIRSRWFPFPHSPSSTIAWYSWSKRVNMLLLVWLEDVTFTSPQASCGFKKLTPQWHLQCIFKSFPGLLSPLVIVISHLAMAIAVSFLGFFPLRVWQWSGIQNRQDTPIMMFTAACKTYCNDCPHFNWGLWFEVFCWCYSQHQKLLSYNLLCGNNKSTITELPQLDKTVCCSHVYTVKNIKDSHPAGVTPYKSFIKLKSAMMWPANSSLY